MKKEKVLLLRTLRRAWAEGEPELMEAVARRARTLKEGAIAFIAQEMVGAHYRSREGERDEWAMIAEEWLRVLENYQKEG